MPTVYPNESRLNEASETNFNRGICLPVCTVYIYIYISNVIFSLFSTLAMQCVVYHGSKAAWV